MMSDGEQPTKPAASSTTEIEIRESPGLRSDTLDAFITWAAGMPVGNVDLIRESIAAARGDDAVFERLVAELADLPVRDVGRHRVLLSTIGELRDARAVEPLSRFIWHATIVVPERGGDGCGFEASIGESLQARAVEMLSFLGSDAATEETLRVAAEHPSQGVRAAAIDAHLYNHDDATEEGDRLRQRVRDTDAPLVGLPRFTRHTTRADFERSVEEYLERHPTQRPPRPELPSIDGPTPQQRADEESGDVQ